MFLGFLLNIHRLQLDLLDFNYLVILYYRNWDIFISIMIFYGKKKNIVIIKKAYLFSKISYIY